MIVNIISALKYYLMFLNEYIFCIKKTIKNSIDSKTKKKQV